MIVPFSASPPLIALPSCFMRGSGDRFFKSVARWFASFVASELDFADVLLLSPKPCNVGSTWTDETPRMGAELVQMR
jgi:hypothetical protein